MSIINVVSLFTDKLNYLGLFLKTFDNLSSPINHPKCMDHLSIAHFSGLISYQVFPETPPEIIIWGGKHWTFQSITGKQASPLSKKLIKT